MTPAEASSELRQYIASYKDKPGWRENKAAVLGLLRARSLLGQFSNLELWARTGMIRARDGRMLPLDEENFRALERFTFFMFEEFQKEPGGPWRRYH